MGKIREGLNKRNLDYWRDVVFYGYQGKNLELATLYAYKVCSEQEINRLKERIIKLEKRFNN
jgi:hypothetical protein